MAVAKSSITEGSIYYPSLRIWNGSQPGTVKSLLAVVLLRVATNPMVVSSTMLSALSKAYTFPGRRASIS
jgi:hypothetical protein